MSRLDAVPVGLTATWGSSMKAQRVVLPVTAAESWTVVDADFVTVEPAERYLAYLGAIERSPNTVRAYAQSLALWMEFLHSRDVGWAGAGVEDVASFVTWLRAPAPNVIVLDASAARRAESTVNLGCVKDSGHVLGVGSGSGCCAEVFGEDCRGGAVAQGGMVSFPVVEHFDVFSDGEACTGSGFESVPVVHLVLQRREE